MTDADDDEKPAPRQGANSDLRFTEQNDGHTEIERDLGSSGRLARGDHTHMHSVRFVARGVPRARQKLAPENTPAERNDEEDGGATAAAPAPAPPAVAAADPQPPDANIARRMFEWMLGRDSR